MKWYLLFKYSFKKKKKKIKIYNQLKLITWVVDKNYFKKINDNINPNIKKKINNYYFVSSQHELFAFRFLINNFCSNGKFLKYSNLLKNIISNLFYYLFSPKFIDLLKQNQLNKVKFFKKNLKTNPLLGLADYLIFFFFTKYKILFFFKITRLPKRIAKRLKKKFKLTTKYIIEQKRLNWLIKIWKNYTLTFKNKNLKSKLFFGFFSLLYNQESFILNLYKKKVLKRLIKAKKYNL